MEEYLDTRGNSFRWAGRVFNWHDRTPDQALRTVDILAGVGEEDAYEEGRIGRGTARKLRKFIRKNERGIIEFTRN